MTLKGEKSGVFAGGGSVESAGGGHRTATGQRSICLSLSHTHSVSFFGGTGTANAEPGETAGVEATVVLSLLLACACGGSVVAHYDRRPLRLLHVVALLRHLLVPALLLVASRGRVPALLCRVALLVALRRRVSKEELMNKEKKKTIRPDMTKCVPSLLRRITTWMEDEHGH